jgi:hypothetical protein
MIMRNGRWTWSWWMGVKNSVSFTWGGELCCSYNV